MGTTVVVVGVSGVGKSTVVEAVGERLDSFTTLDHGTMVVEEARDRGLLDGRRDELSFEEYRRLRRHVLSDTNARNDDLLLDSRCAIGSGGTHTPGLTRDALDDLDPDICYLLTAEPAVIRKRRLSDEKDRDVPSVEQIRRELAVERSMASTVVMLTGAYFEIVPNGERSAEETAAALAESITA